MDMNRVLNYIEDHLEERLTNKQLADIAGYSEYHFMHLFKAHTNESVGEYICRRKLIKSLDDIVAGKRLLDVALKYGFQSHSAFSKAFKREFGLNPSLLRTMRLELDCVGGNMNQIFLHDTKVGTSKEDLLDVLKKVLNENNVALEDSLIDQVYKVACRAYEGKKRYSGEEFVTHTINVAILLAEIGAGADVILAGMFCDEAYRCEDELICNDLPVSVWEIIKQNHGRKCIPEELSDEVILIKLAERLHNMRTIEFIDDRKKKIKAKETVEIYMPLARRVNNQKLIDELNDLAMRYVK